MYGPPLWPTSGLQQKNDIFLVLPLKILVFDQSFPVQPVSESSGVSLSLSDEEQKDGNSCV